MNKTRVLTAMLALSGAATLAPLTAAFAQTATGTATGAAQNQRAVLAGRFRGLAWSVFGPGQLQGLSATTNTLRVSAHPLARVLGAKWDGRNIIVAFRVAAPLQTVYNYHAQQLTQQGFRRDGDAPNLGADVGNVDVEFTRGDDTVELKLSREPSNVYRALFDLEGVQGDTTGDFAPGQQPGTATVQAPAGTATGATGVTGTATGAARTATGTATGPVNAGTNNNTDSTATGNAGTTGGTPSAPNRVEDPLSRAVVGDLNRLRVTVLPQAQARPAAAGRNTAGAFYLQPFQAASKTTVNFTGNELFMAYFVNASLQQQFNYYDAQFRAQGFQRVNSDAAATGTAAATNEIRAIYRRGPGTVGVTVDEFGGTNGYRLRANFDDLVRNLATGTATGTTTGTATGGALPGAPTTGTGAATGTATGGSTGTASATIAGLVSTNPQFSTLLRAVQAAGLADTLAGTGPFTVFAPTNAAFAKIPAAQLNALLANREQLRQVLLNHVVSGRLNSTQAVQAGTARTLAGNTVTIRSSGGRVTVGNAAVVTPNVDASNGIVHAIDTVLLPTAGTTTGTTTGTR